MSIADFEKFWGIEVLDELSDRRASVQIDLEMQNSAGRS